MASTRKFFCVIFTLCFLIASLSFHLLRAEEKIPIQTQPQISFDSNGYDAGEVWEGEKVFHDFIVKNTGTAELQIEKVKTG